MRRDDYQATFLVAMGLAAATLTGFLRQAVIAYQLGAGRSTDIYLVAFALPEFVFNALLVIIPSAFIPLFVQYREERGAQAGWRFAIQTAGVVLFFLIALVAAALLMLPTFIGWLSPGFTQSESSQAVKALWYMLPAVPLMGLAMLAGSTLQVFRRFAWASGVTAVYNITFIAVLLWLPVTPLEQRAAWSVTAGAAAGLLFQVPVLWTSFRKSASQGIRATLAPGIDRKAMAEFSRLSGPLIAGYAVHHLILFVDRAMATALGSGSVAALNYAYHLALAVGQLSGLAVATVIFPALSAHIGRGELDRARQSISASLKLVSMIAFPASAGLILLRMPLVRLLFERGAFDEVATAAVSLPLLWYVLAVLSDAICQPLWRVIYAQRSPWVMFSVNGLQTAVRLVFNIVLVRQFGYVGLAMSAAIGIGLQVLILGWLVHRILHFRLSRNVLRHFLNVAVATAFAIVIAGLLSYIFQYARPEVTLMMSGGPGMLAYLFMIQNSKKWR